jgi:predicted ATPase
MQACHPEAIAGSFHEARKHAEETVALSNEHGFSYMLGCGMLLLGWSMTALGQVQEGLAVLTTGLSVYRGTGAALATPAALVWLAEAYAKLARPIEGLDRLAEAAQIIEVTDERWDEAKLHRLRGDLLNATDDKAAAEHSFQQALAVAERQSAKTSELYAATSLARFWGDQGKRTEARDLLAPIYGWVTEGLDTPVLQEAKALLDQLK